MNPLDDALTALERVTGYRPIRAGDGYKARCPCHDDKNPSLSVKTIVSDEAGLIPEPP